jgi:hypothetical protein
MSEADVKETAVFVSNANSLRDAPGGQQICTQEFLETVKCAGFAPQVVDFEFRRDWPARLRRKLRPNPYRNALPDGLANKVAETAARAGATWVFLNLTELTPLAEPLKSVRPSLKIAVLSHGAESVDDFHSLRIKSARTDGRPATIRERLKLSDQLLDEAAARRFIDHIFVLAPFEVEVERWLGARRATWIPRQVKRRPLEWKPVHGRMGFVGMLDHWPTVEALEHWLPELSKLVGDDIRLRLVGSPTQAGEALAAKNRFIDFLGGLDDAGLRAEAATWTCYPQPLFCWGRGCSTKLATTLSWGIPVATTPQGVRGYCWKDGGVTLAETPAEVAEAAVRLARDEAFRRSAKEAVDSAAASAPTLAEVADLMRNALERS